MRGVARRENPTPHPLKEQVVENLFPVRDKSKKSAQNAFFAGI